MSSPNTESVAAVDLGSNSFHMVVARVVDDTHFHVVDRLRERVALAAGLDEHEALTDKTQERALAALRIGGKHEFSRRDYEQAAGLGRTAAGEEISQLVRHGILVTRGASSTTRYAFTAPVGGRSRGETRGRKAKWTDAVIEERLREFLAGRSDWPSRDEFKAAGRLDLYAAASRNGSIRRWRAKFGI